ncbi:MAG TPA: hypothetical protein VFW33_11240, partial [Gemmataceae bacterium]|nr:hypothetical protein [Gemmataceae bacterium]
TSNYEKAAKAFNEAVILDEVRPEYRVNLGRCLYRAARNAQRTLGRLDERQQESVREAEKQLLKVRETAANTKDGAEACEWLGLIYRYLKPDLTRAEQYLGEAVAQAKVSSPQGMWPIVCDEWMQVAWSRYAADTKNTAALRQCRERAEMLLRATKDGHVNAARYLGLTYQYENKPKEAVEAYGRALPELEKAGPEHLPLLLERVTLYLNSQWNNILRPDFQGTVIPEADRAIAIAKGMANDRDTQAEALGLAGRAYSAAAGLEKDDSKKLVLREEARDRLQEALKKAPNHKERGRWQGMLAYQLMILRQDPQYSAQKADYRERARTLLDEAIRNSPDKEFRNQCEDWRDELK